MKTNSNLSTATKLMVLDLPSGAIFIPVMTPIVSNLTRWRAVLPPQRVMFILGVYVISMLFFSLLRLLFYLNLTVQAQGEPFSQVATAFLIGLRFDQIIVLASLAPVILVAPWVSPRSRLFQRLIVAWLTVIFSLHFLLLLADVRFYYFFDSHLNFLAVEYVGDGSMFGNLVFSDKEFFPLLFAWLLLTVLYFVFIRLILKRVTGTPHRRSWPNHIAYFIVLLMLLALGIRGRISLAPIDWGLAYFSQNRFLNQLALNGIYTLGRNLTENNRDPRLVYVSDNERFALVDFADALKTTQNMLGLPGDQWLQPFHSLLRLTRQPEAPYGFQPNLVIIMSESWPAGLTGALTGSRNLTPNFDRLARQGALFENFYASGSRTNYGIAAVICSFPSLPGRAIMKRYNALHPFVSLSELLAERGYLNAFIYGGDLAFDNMEGFLREKKFHAFFGDDQLGKELYFSKWGIPDHLLFEKAANLIDSFPRPFQLTLLTLSNHEPWDLPDSTVRRYMDDADTSKIFNSQIYADDALGRFFALVEKMPVSDSTIFLFVSDHARYGPSRFALDPEFFHVPLLIYAPALLLGQQGRHSTYGSQTDILPTVMGLLGGDYRHASWGRDLFNLPEGDSGFAVLNIAGRIGYIDSDYLYVEELGGLSGYGSRNPSAGETSWFGYATLKELDLAGRSHNHDNWKQAFVASLEGRTRFAIMHALNRVASFGRGHLLIQSLKVTDDDSFAPQGGEPEGHIWARERLHRYMQLADQLSTPEER